jgi:hypothetical protein
VLTGSVRRLVALVLVGALASCGGSTSPVERARRIVDDDDRFATSIEAGDALANVGSILLRAGKDCDDDRCGALLSASAFAQVLAVRVLDCTAPGRFQMRRAMRSYLDAVAAARRHSGVAVPQPPEAPRCRPPSG